MPAFLDMFTNDVQVYQMGMEYAVIVFAFSTITMANLSFEKIFQSVGRMKVSMIGLLCGSITNIILDPLLIFGIGIFRGLVSPAQRCHSDRSAVYPPSLPDGVQQAPDPGQNPQRIPCFS